MSTKKKLSSSAKQSKTSGSWTEALEAITINDDQWWCTMTMIVETVPSQARIVQLFEEASENGSRRAIHVLTCKKLMSSVKVLSRVDEDKGPVAQGVFHHASRLIARGENVEAWLMARLVKYLVYRAKMETNARVRRETDIEHEVDRSIRAMLTVTHVESQRSMKSAKTKDSDRTFEVPVTSKPNTHLRKRGEAEKYKIYTDDAPENGPHLFIILAGFRDPSFPLELIKTGLPLICVLRIRSPVETHIEFENSERHLEKNRQVFGSNKNIFHKSTEKEELTEFWRSFEKSLTDPKTLEAYSNVLIRNFCPPEIPSSDDHEKVEKYKQDLYDRVSYIVYDLYDLQSLHTEYIRNMKLLHIPEEPPGESNIYKTIMDAVPVECCLVSVILQAMIVQVEANVRNKQPPKQSSPGSDQVSAFNEEPMTGEELENKEDVSRLLIIDNDPGIGENNRRSNLSSQIFPTKSLSASGVSPTVILECDQLQLRTYQVSLSDDIIRLVKPAPTSLAEFGQRSFQDPRIIGLWSQRGTITEDEQNKHQNDLKKIAQCFSFPMDSKRLIHYLHLRFFDKMIHARLDRTSTSREDGGVVIAKNKEVFRLATRSDPFPLPSRDIQTDQTLASSGDPISNLRTSRSDSIIDYQVAQGDIQGLPEMLGAPKNSHKMLVDLDPPAETGSEKLGETREDSSYLEKFIDVRLLSSRTLLQAVHECFQEYPRFYSEYFELTDSMLLCFGHVDKPRKSSRAKENEEERLLFYDQPYPLQTFRMVTPVGFRNFCEYIIHEEEDFIRDVEKLRSSKRSMNAGELTRKLSQHSDIGILEVMTFTEDDFILPNSIKGQARRQNSEFKTSNDIEMPSNKIDKPTVTSNVDDKIKKDKSSAKKHTREKSLTSMTTADVLDDAMTVRTMPSLRCTRENESYKFIGYDIGKFRVHLTTRSETFASPDGTLVKVDLDEWLHGKSFLGIGIDLQGCFLKVQRTIGYHGEQNLPFHLTTNNGIVMAFSKISGVEGSSNLEEGQSSVAFEFGASWPSGLLVELVKDNRFENPFYIQQRYVAKGSECGNVSRESYRKFLRNGTVLKFLSDNEIEVLRPNSTIVQCFEYAKFSRDLGSRSNANYSKEEFPTSLKRTKDSTATRGKRKSSSPRKSTGKSVDAERTRKRLNVTSTVDPSSGGIYSAREDAAKVKITRYTAVEHDGRCYEVENGEVSRVYERSLVRTSTDVEACEKFARRDDGTQSVLNSRGELFVSFPDGTRIVTGYMIEEEPLLCDWSDDEFRRFFASDLDVNLSQRQNDEAISSRFSNVTRTDSYRSEFRRPTNRGDKVGIFLSDAFVSVLLTCRMEHECYATVAYEPIKNSCRLSMPDDVEIQISREGFFDIGVGQDAELLIRDDKLTFSSKMCADGRSVSIYDLRETKMNDEASENSETLLVTTDSLGKTFKVKVDGNVIHDNRSTSNPSGKAHRLFAVNRDLTGFEYLHKSERDNCVRKINSTRSESMFIPILSNGFSEYRLFLNPLEPRDYSRKWLQKVTSIDKNHRHRLNFPRSTYANPYDWIFPFGSDAKHTARAEKTIAKNNNKVFTLNVLQGIANEGDRFLDEVEKAITRCHQTVNNASDDYRCFNDESLTSTSVREIEKYLENLSLGIEMNIDIIKYLGALSSKIMDKKSGQIHEFSKCSKQKQRALMKTEEIQWYERCLRERIILPYFKTIQGSCFLWITSCVDRALQLVE